MSPSKDGRPPALLVVHGISTQRRGDTLAQCARGLLAVCPGAILAAGTLEELKPDGIQEQQLGHVRLRQGECELRLCEVYWADLLPSDAVEGAFSQFAFEETTWFGWLNWKAGLLPREQYSGALVVARTLQLWTLQVMMSLALEVVGASRRIRSHVLDQTAADVWAYAHSLAGELKAGSPLTGAADRALNRFLTAWRQAREDGAGEVHVIAHSLGTVVTYHAMARRLPPDAIRRLVTIGSPLEKVRFLWTKLFPPRLDWSCEWINVFTPSDPVSGRLKRFDSLSARVQNRRLWGVGGYGEAHVGYFRDGRVMGPLAEGLGLAAGGRPGNSGPSWLIRRLVDVVVPVATATLAVLGAALTIAFFWLMIRATGWLMALPVRLVSAEWAAAVDSWWRTVFGWALPVLWLTFLTKDGYRRSATRHARRWRDGAGA